MGTALLLAVVVGSATIPIPESAIRFPDPSGSAGVGMRQEVLMLTRALSDSGGLMRAVGPGPQQLVARWTAGQLNAAEKVAVLLGGAAFHDTALLRIYDEASRDPDRRVLQAAVAGFFALIGDDPPLPSTVADTAAERERFSDLVRSFGWALRSKPLVGIWVDSFAAGRGHPISGRFALRRSGEQCLRAIREIARPEDLPEVLALWPLLVSDGDRVGVMRTLEMITLQKLVDEPEDPAKPRGAWLTRAGLARVDAWVAGTCRPPNGLSQVRAAFERNKLVEPGGTPSPEAWFRLMRFKYASFLPLALEHLSDLTGTRLAVDRHDFDGTTNANARNAIAQVLPISSGTAVPQRRRR
jgi:hypothetical protein